MSLLKDPAFLQLQQHYESECKYLKMADLFKQDPQRFQKYRLVSWENYEYGIEK